MKSTEVREFLKKQFTVSLATTGNNSIADIAIILGCYFEKSYAILD